MIQEIDDDRYGKIVHSTLWPSHLALSPPWDEVSASMRRVYRDAARAVIDAWQRDHAQVDEDGIPLYPDGGDR
jgi:hypothetical protein